MTAARRKERRAPDPSRVVARFPRVTALVAGDLMLDQFVWGKVGRISPEAPVPVVQVTTESFRLGGAANVVHNIRSLGGGAIVCGALGRDGAGRRVIEELRRIGADTAGVVMSGGHATTCKIRIIAHQQQVVRLDRENDDRLETRSAARARGFLLTHVWAADVVVLSDYGKGLITPRLLAALAAARARRPFRLVVDPKQSNFAHYAGASLVTPNRDEASLASGIEIRDDESLHAAGAALLERWQAEAVLVTRGEEGMSLFRRDAPARHFPVAARHVYDVTGAGDTVIATLALALGAGADLETAAVLSNHAAGIVVGEVGTATVTARQLLDELRGR